MSSFVKQQLEYGTDNNLNSGISTSFSAVLLLMMIVSHMCQFLRGAAGENLCLFIEA